MQSSARPPARATQKRSASPSLELTAVGPPTSPSVERTAQVDFALNIPPKAPPSRTTSASLGIVADDLFTPTNALYRASTRLNFADLTTSNARGLVEIFFEDADFLKFKRMLMENSVDVFSVSLMVSIILFLLIFTTSSNTSSSELSSAIATASTVTRVISFLLLIPVFCIMSAIQHLDASGRFASVRALSLNFCNTSVFPYVLNAVSLAMTLQPGLKLIWYTTLEQCTGAPESLFSLSCNPSLLSLPSDRVAILFVIPVVIHVLFPSIPLRISILSWLIGCTCLVISYFRLGEFADGYNIINACFFLYILIKIDASTWSSYILHRKSVADAEREIEASLRTRKLELALLEAENHALENRSSELRALMGNVAHDLKTPIQSMLMGIENLRYRVRAPLPPCICMFVFEAASRKSRICFAPLKPISSRSLMSGWNKGHQQRCPCIRRRSAAVRYSLVFRKCRRKTTWWHSTRFWTACLPRVSL
jgi:hypothetical protein